MDITDGTLLKQGPTQIVFIKGQDTFTPIGRYIDRDEITDPHNIDLKLKINHEDRIAGNTNQMIWRIPQIIQECSHYMTLEEGDLLLTGTPVPPGLIKIGDHVHCELSENGKSLDKLELNVVEG
mmetsp:Transcript_1281/g.1435  ORF Transcript_1281/g.1435 Transcript_1281/m.1435 type:complete len:124 (+) Transcript_1281:288-659(+)